MSLLRLLSKILVLSLILLSGCICRKQPSDDNSLIDKSMFLHKIRNKELLEQVVKYNDKYKHYDQAQDKGLEILFEGCCFDSTTYFIGYSGNIRSETPIILCEPIDDKPVALVLAFLWNDFMLSERQSIELQKESNPKEYDIHLYDLTHPYITNMDTIFMGDTVPPIIMHVDTLYNETMIMSHFVKWHLVFDKDGHLLRVDTAGMNPDH